MAFEAKNDIITRYIKWYFINYFWIIAIHIE
jgi:hypothetical protein